MVIFQLKLFITLLLLKIPLKSDPHHTDDFSINESHPQAPRDTMSREYQELSTVKMCFLQLAFPALSFRLYISSPDSCRINFFSVEQNLRFLERDGLDRD